MPEDETYNGWSSNNEGYYRQMCEKAEDLVRQYQDEITRGAISCFNEMADYIKEWTEEVYEMVLHPDNSEINLEVNEEARMFVSDVGSWWRADFYEIAEHWIDNAKEAVGVE